MECKSKVYNINNFNINDVDKGAVIALDTNILYWMHYSRCAMGGDPPHQILIYPDVIENLISNEVKLVTTIYNVTELINIIERHENEIYNLTHKKTNLKDFRKIKNERENVQAELEAVLGQIKSLYEVFEYKIEVIGVNSFIENFNNHSCDNFDYSIINYLKGKNINSIISDDKDFISIDGIVLYTANRYSIKKAKENKQLVN